MNFDKEKYLKEDKTLKDAVVLENREGEEVHEKTLHIAVTNAETGEIKHEFDTSCCLVFGIKKDSPTEACNFCFTAAPVKDIIHLLRSAKKGTDMLMKSDPNIEVMMKMEELLAGIGAFEEDEE